MKFKRTKPFLLATAGSTVDGRVIDDKMLDEMASSYNPKTYGARLNIEHIRGITGDKPFRSYGDVVELSVGEVEVDFNGTKEKRKALYGVFDVLEDAQQLNAAGQKVYPSIEIEPNFGGKGFAYLMGCALTDSPAAIATERLQFNTARPGALNLNGDSAASLEFADEKGDTTPEGGSFLKALTAVLDKFAGKSAEPAAQPQGQQPAQGAAPQAPQAADAAMLTGLFTEMGKAFQASLNDLQSTFTGEINAMGLKLQALDQKFEGTAAPDQPTRPTATGGNFAKTAF